MASGTNRKMMDNGSSQLNLARLDLSTLTNLLLNPQQDLETQREVLTYFSDLPAAVRTPRVIAVLVAMMKKPHQHNRELILSAVELLATDPEPEATQGLFEVLPYVSQQALEQEAVLDDEFREYFYQALMTRRRETDLDVWREALPGLDGNTLLAILIDPVAGLLRSVFDPFDLIDRLPEPERGRTLRAVIMRGDAKLGWRATRLLFRGR